MKVARNHEGRWGEGEVCERVTIIRLFFVFAFFFSFFLLLLLSFIFKPWCWCIRLVLLCFLHIRSFVHVQICLVVGLFNDWWGCGEGAGAKNGEGKRKGMWSLIICIVAAIRKALIHPVV